MYLLIFVKIAVIFFMLKYVFRRRYVFEYFFEKSENTFVEIDIK